MIIAIRARIRANRSRSGVLDPEDRRSFSSVLLDFPKTLASGEMEVVGGTRSSDLLQSVVAGVAFLYVF